MSAYPGDPDDYIEGPVGSGQWWLLLDAEAGKVYGPLVIRSGLTPHDLFLKQEKRQVPKSVIVSRLIAAGKIGKAYAALNSKPEAWARWVASDRPAINSDDPDAIALLKAIGADPEAILAP